MERMALLVGMEIMDRERRKTYIRYNEKRESAFI
jgi:hypothetical protein